MTSRRPLTPLSYRSLWRLPVSVAVVGLSALLVLHGDGLGGVVAAQLAAAAVVVATTRRREATLVDRPRAWRDPGSALVLGAALACLPAIGGDSAAVHGAGLLAGAAVVLAAVVTLLFERVRSYAAEVAVECAIAAVSLSLLAWELGLSRVPGGLSPVRLTTFLALGCASAAALCLFSLLSLDAARPGNPFVLDGTVIVSLAALATIVFVAAGTPRPRGGVFLWVDIAAIVVLAAASAARAHPRAATRRGPTLQVRRSTGVSRSVMFLASVMAGPLLIVAHLVLGVDLSLTTTAIVSGSVSLASSLHVFGLMRRWNRLEHDVYHDGLTGLPNRALFFERLNAALDVAQLERHTVALMFLDLDRFKNVNDSLGHAAGNELLRQVARRVGGAVDRRTTVARLSGDEFGVLVPHVSSYEVSRAIGSRILAAFEQPFALGNRAVYVTPSVGIAHYPNDGTDPSTLLEHADHAMYRAKAGGRNTVVTYARDRRGHSSDRLDMETALHRAAEDGQLRLLYQPKIDVEANEVFGVEALMRWQHPTLGAVSPEVFIPLAEETGLIDKLGEWALDQACRQGRRWQSEFGLDLTVAVNLSPRQFQVQRVQDLVTRVLRTTGFDPHLLELELTESLALEEPERVSQVLAELKACGVRFAIDDFGVGYSGLGYLDRFAFDVVKIDRGFVHRINGQSAHIVTAVIALAQGLGLDVVAEGVETLEQVEFLRRRGCNLMQGYIFSKAIDGDALGHMILQRREVLAGRMRAEDERDSALLPVPVSKVASAPVGRLRRQSA